MVTQFVEDVSSARGLAPEDRALVRDLTRVWERHVERNWLREGYYSMHRAPRDLGISVPPNLASLEQVIGWPAKAVTALADRSQFDGFVCDDEDASATLSALVSGNGLKAYYRRAVRDELKLCCSFLAVTAGDTSAGEPECVVTAYPATSAAGIWDWRLKRIRAGLVVVDRDPRPGSGNPPTWVDVFTDENVIQVVRTRGGWEANYVPHSMGRCLMEPMAYDSTIDRPFGRSRISRAVMNITDDAMRSSVRSEVSAEFFTSPQKYLLGADSESLGGRSKWDAYIGKIFAVGKDEDGDVPSFGQLAQGSMQPHIDYMRSLAARFSGETNVPMSELGVVSDNPSSAEAIYAAKEPLVVEAQNLNADNGEALRNVALMALAIHEGTGFAEQRDRGLTLQPRFRNPAMPSIVSQADAMTKMIAALPWLADSDVALEEFGFTDEQIQRLRSDRTRYQSRALVAQATAGTGLAIASNPTAPAAGDGA